MLGNVLALLDTAHLHINRGICFILGQLDYNCVHFQGELSTRLLLVFDKDELIARWSSSMDNSSGFSLIAYAHLLLSNLLFRKCPTCACVVRVICEVWGKGETWIILTVSTTYGMREKVLFSHSLWH